MAKSKRGFASMDPELRREIARKGGRSGGPGRGWRGDPVKHAKAGKKGGQTTAKQHGVEFYRKIGEQGGKASPGKFQKGSERAREAGRKGGKAKTK